MKKTETLRQLAAAQTDTRLDTLGQKIESLRQAKTASAEELASILEPLAQAMAALTDDTRETLEQIASQSKAQGEAFQQQIATAVAAWTNAAQQAQEAAESLSRAGQRMEWRHYLLASTTGLVSALLVTVFWHWLAPPAVTVENRLDAKAVAESLRPAISALKPSRGK